jgi:hypothetical protein
MMKQQHLPQEKHPIETALADLIGELWNLLLQVGQLGKLHKLIEQQLGTTKDQQVRAQLEKIQKLLQQQLSGTVIRGLYDIATTMLWNAGRNLLNEITKYRKLIGDQGEGDIKTKVEGAKKPIKDIISHLKEKVKELQQGASTLKQGLQNIQSSAQQQEIASVIQQAMSEIGDIDVISDRIKSIAEKLEGLEKILERTPEEVEQLLSQQRERPDTVGGTTGSTSTSSEQEPSNQASELEDKIMDLYRAVVALEILVNTAIENAGIIPKQFEGINTYTVSQELRSINYKHLNTALTFLEKYTGMSRPSLLDALSSAKQGNATQPRLLKQQQTAPDYDIPEGIKIYLERFKTFLVDIRNHVRKKLDEILREVSELGNNIDQISDIGEKQQAQKVCSIPTFIILGTCANKLDDELPQSTVEAAAPVLGAIIIARSIWTSLLRRDGWAEQVLQEIHPQFQDPGIREGLHHIQVVLAHDREEARGKTPPKTAEAVGATVLGAIGAFVQPAVKQLRQGAPGRKGKKLKRVLLITNTTLIRDTTNQAAEEKEIPTLTEGGTVKNTKEMINALVKFMNKYWESIMYSLNNDIDAGRFSDPSDDIKTAIKEVNVAWQELISKMREIKWKEEYSYDATREMKKIEGIKTELEKLLNAWFNLFEKWKAAHPKLEAGALNLKYLLFHPLGLPALRIALTTLPASISFEGAATPEEVTQTGGPQKRIGGRKLGAQQRKGEPESGPTYPLSPGGKEATEKTLQEEITIAINFIKKRQVDDAIKAVATAITILRDIGNQKPQPQGAFPTHLREAASYLRVALQRLRDASQLDPDSDGFNDNLRQANSLLQEALKGLSNPTAGSTPYLGRNLLLLMKTLRSVPSTAQSHHQRTKNEDILEKETI